MVKLIATVKLPYGKGYYAPGDEIPDVSEKDAKLLVGIGKARFADQSSPTDLPKAVRVDPVEVVEEAAPEAIVDPRTDTRDIAQTAGRTGVVKPSRSSRLARRQRGKT